MDTAETKGALEVEGGIVADTFKHCRCRSEVAVSSNVDPWMERKMMSMMVPLKVLRKLDWQREIVNVDVWDDARWRQ